MYKRGLALWVALLFSVLAHALTLSGNWLRIPQSPSDPLPPPLSARLQAAAPVVETLTPVADAPKPAPRPAKITAAPAPRVDAAAWTPPPAALALPQPEPATVAENEPEAPAAEPTAQAEPAEPITLAAAEASTFKPEPAQIKTLPRRGRIAYDLNYYLAGTPTLVGRTVQTWEASESNYKLESRSEPVGLARLTRFGPRAYESSGTVTPGGLQPREFSSKIMLRGKPEDTLARFDWGNQTLQFGRMEDLKNSALPAGSQDLLSFMFQLSLAPPPKGRLSMPITNGARFERYDIDVLDETTIETPLGALRALPVKRAPRPGREGIEVWLAVDYQYLPVRIVVTNRDGSPGGEQLVTEINIGEK